MYLQVLGKVGTETDFIVKDDLISQITKLMNNKKEPLRASAISCIVSMSIADPKAFLKLINFNNDQDIEQKIFVLTSIKQLTLLRNIPTKLVS